ncbi:MAG: His/Gly/Thr/Pro-type tRNA ligase C-terminal domain-containing protein, partial [Candidatus Omnitrophica bacterium]|nr:His/Gly/Thr/Pro-type tRNA ligase C-terminal domain-containing protein [Candidatus Omnitrophota bacterium]
KVLGNIENIVRQEMNSCGAVELLLPALQPLELWQRSGRDALIGEVMIKFTDRRGRKICLGPTHEEVITELIKTQVSSYKQLPLILYQIQTKFRDELRPRFGLVRACEFIMKDAYSFDQDEAGLDKNYQAMHAAYLRIFKRCGLDIITTEADSGVMGGKVSHEFMVPAKDGEDVVEVNAEKVNAIEVGHIFKLGTKYSASLDANFLDAQGQLKPVIMGCYGIGVSRLISSVIEQNNDKDGIIWPLEVAPYKVMILVLDAGDKKIMDLALAVYQELEKNGIEPLLDDRDERGGVKFKDADLLGIPLQVIVGKNSLKDGTLELKIRRSQEKIIQPKEGILREIIKLSNG